LLKALTVFPRGEQLLRIARFNGHKGFFIENAKRLKALNLIESTTTEGVGSSGDDESARTLFVLRPIRDYVRGGLDAREIRALNERAAELYFGPNWVLGTYKPRHAYRGDNPQAAAGDIANASTILKRLINDAIETEDKRRLEAGFELASAFVGALHEGDHFRSVALICEDLEELALEAGFGEKAEFLAYQKARGLRMIDRVTEAAAIFSKLAATSVAKERRQSILLNLALCFESLGSDAKAIETALNAERINRKSGNGIHARCIVIKLTGETDRLEVLRKFERKCRRTGAHSLANNIALIVSHALKRSRPDDAKDILNEVMIKAELVGDYYNLTRAAVDLADITLRGEASLPLQDQHRLIAAYHYLFNERIPGVFERCHDVLWRALEAANDVASLLVLFRQSSFLWRIRGSDHKESKYIGSLSARLSGTLPSNILNMNRELAYFHVRAAPVALVGPA
jgi:tetratricopeptide (TPR) repeat protein